MAFDYRTMALFVSLTSPMGQVWDANGDVQTMAGRTVSLGIIIVLDSIFNSNRHATLSQDQYETYLQLEDAIVGINLNGRGCLLRFICEMQTAKLSEKSFGVRMLRKLLKPIGEGRKTILKEYVAAEEYGMQGVEVCKKQYGKRCKIPVLETLARNLGIKDIHKLFNSGNSTVT